AYAAREVPRNRKLKLPLLAWVLLAAIKPERGMGVKGFLERCEPRNPKVRLNKITRSSGLRSFFRPGDEFL
ncbi:MAG: hypothetical protein AAB676_06585, partial [Verrucomicrobiota bacterium]